MSPAIISLIIQLVSGAAGGNVIGALVKKLPVDKILATVLGAIGGAGGTQLALLIPQIKEMLEQANYGGDAGAGAAGGALLTLIVGLIKKATAGPSAAA